MTQAALGARIDASRFWVAEFEKGKPSAELGLALKAIQAVGLAIRIEPRNGRAAGRVDPQAPPENTRDSALTEVLARATADGTASSVTGWPTAREPAQQRPKP